jgi:hypothetical protein
LGWLALLALPAAPARADTARAVGASSATRSPAMPAKTRSAGQPDFDIQQLASLFPATLGDWTRDALGQPQPSPMKEPRPVLRAVYRKAEREAEVAVTTSLPIAVPKGSRAITQQRDDVRKLATATLPLSNGIVIVASSMRADGEELARLIQSIDLARAESLVRSGRKP